MPPPIPQTLANRLKWLAIALGGVPIMASGLYALLVSYAFATMIDPAIRGRDRWIAILKEMFFTPSAFVALFGIATFSFGALFAATSVLRALGILNTGRRTIISVAVAAVVVLLAGVLLLASS